MGALPTKTEDFTVVALATYNYRLLAWNWALHMQRLGISNYLVYCVDELVYEFLISKKINCQTFYVDGKRDAISLQKSFMVDIPGSDRKTIFYYKTLLFKQALNTHGNIVFSDLDAIWKKDPFPLIINLCREYDTLFSIEIPPLAWPGKMRARHQFTLNTGWFVLQSKPAVHTFVEDWLLYGSKYRDDQKACNFLLLDKSPVLKRLKREKGGGGERERRICFH